MSSIVYKCCIIALGVTPRGSLESIQGHSFKFSIMHCAEIAELVNSEDVDVEIEILLQRPAHFC